MFEMEGNAIRARQSSRKVNKVDFKNVVKKFDLI